MQKQLKVDRMRRVGVHILTCEGSTDQVPLQPDDVHSLVGKSLDDQWKYVNTTLRVRLTPAQKEVIDRWQQ